MGMTEWCKACKAKDGEKYDEAASKKEFKIIDQSNSGTISLAELDLWVKTKQLDAVRVRFKSADKSGDRKLDKKEFSKWMEREMADGVLAETFGFDANQLADAKKKK